MSADSKGRSYSAVQGKQHLVRMAAALVITGTNATDTNDTTAILLVPSTWNGVLKSASLYLRVGATGAGSLAVRIERSLAGTGTYTTIGTVALAGTKASASLMNFTVTETQILGGDTLRITVGSGTIAVDASTVTAHIDLCLEESFVGA